MVVGSSCDICSAVARDGLDRDDRAAREAHAMNVVIFGEGPAGGKMVDIAPTELNIWAAPPAVYTAILDVVLDEEYENVIGACGRDFIVEYNKDESPSKKYSVKLRDANRCREVPADVLNKVRDLYLMPNFAPAEVQDELKAISTNTAAEKPVNKSKTKATAPAKTAPAPQKKEEAKPAPRKPAARKPIEETPPFETEEEGLSDEEDSLETLDGDDLVGRKVRVKMGGKVVVGEIVDHSNGTYGVSVNGDVYDTQKTNMVELA